MAHGLLQQGVRDRGNARQDVGVRGSYQILVPPPIVEGLLAAEAAELCLATYVSP